MNSVVLVTLFFVYSVSGSLVSLPFARHPLVTASQYHAQDELGRASFGYSYPGQARSSYQDAYGNQIGSWAYINAEGKEVKVSYVADWLGFRVLSNDLPVAPVDNVIVPSIILNLPQPVQETPEVAAARATLMAAQDEARKAVAAALEAESSAAAALAAESSATVDEEPKSEDPSTDEQVKEEVAVQEEVKSVAEEEPAVIHQDPVEETIHDTYAAASVDLLTSY